MQTVQSDCHNMVRKQYKLRSRTIKVSTPVRKTRKGKCTTKHAEIYYPEDESSSVAEESTPTLSEQGTPKNTSCLLHISDSTPISHDNNIKQKISIDLNELQIDMEQLHKDGSPLELTTVVYPVKVNTNDTQVPTYLSYTYSKQINNEQAPSQQQKCLDMPFLDDSSMSPSPSCSSSISSHVSQDNSCSVSSLSSKSTDDNNNNIIQCFGNKQLVKYVPKEDKCLKKVQKLRKTRKLSHNTSLLYDAIIQDDVIIQQLKKGLNPRFRIVPRDHKRPFLRCSLNYMKWLLKIEYSNILRSTYPNTQWSYEMTSGVSEDNALNQKRKSEVHVLSNILIPSKSITSSDCSEEQNQDGGSYNDSDTETKVFKVKNLKKHVVDICIPDGADYDELIDRLGPDYIANFRSIRYKKRHTTGDASCSGRIRNRRITGMRITRSLASELNITEMLQLSPTRHKKKRISEVSTEVAVVLEPPRDSAYKKFIPQIDGDDGDGESEDDTSYVFDDLVMNDIELHSVSPTISDLNMSCFHFPSRAETNNKTTMATCSVVVKQLPEEILNKHLKKDEVNYSQRCSGSFKRTSTKMDETQDVTSAIFTYSGERKALDLVLSESQLQSSKIDVEIASADVSYTDFRSRLNQSDETTSNILPPEPTLRSEDRIKRKKCVVNIPRMKKRELTKHLRKYYKRNPHVCQYNLRARKNIPQLDGADDDSSSSDDDECITTTRKRSLRSHNKMAARGRRANVVKAEEIKYPTLDITVTQSPHSMKHSPRMNLQRNSPRRPRTPRRTRAETAKSLQVNTVNRCVDAASRILNFDLGSNQTFIEEKVECRYKPESGSTQNDNVMPLSQLKQKILSKSTLQVEENERKTCNKTEIAEITAKEPEIPVIIDDNDSDELFSSPSDNIIKNMTKDITEKEENLVKTVTPQSKDELTLPSSLEALITPYQENQPADNVMDSYNSQCNLFEDSLNTKTSENSLFIKSTSQNKPEEVAIHEKIQTEIVLDEPVNKLLTKADEYDIANRMLVQAGPSNCPASFESAIMFASSGKPAEQTPTPKEEVSNMNKSINILDLTSHLDIYNAEDVNKMDTVSLNSSFEQSGTCAYITPKYKPPSWKVITETMATYNIPQHKYQDPFYSDPKHVTGAVDVGYNTLKILAKHHYEEFRSSFKSLLDYQKIISGATNQKELKQLKLSYCTSKSVFMQPVKKPPSVKEVKLWLLKKKHSSKKKREVLVEDVEEETCKEVQDHETTELLGLTILEDKENLLEVTSPRLNKSSWDNSHAISGVSLNNTHGFKMTLENLQEARSLDIYQYITSLVMELHAECRGDKLPDPQIDSVKVIFFALANDIPDKSPPSSGVGVGIDSTVSSAGTEEQTEHFLKGFICVSPESSDGSNILTGTGIPLTKYTFTVADELSLFKKFIELYHAWNPDILMGYEIEQASWGYLVDRGYVLGLNMPFLLSRIKETDKKQQAQPTPEEKETHEEHHSHLKVTGRIVIDLWRILKHEIALQSYTFENLAYHVLHERVPRYSPRELYLWWNHKSSKYRHRTVDYFLYRVEGAFRLIDHYDLIGRTSELARLFGILFYEVLSRGSQFRVESMMLRLAKPYKFVPVSPNVQQRAHMKAPEFLPLILEPESKFYKDPVIVLDFQSLYPSMMIAYNYCFSTCLGRVEHLASDAKFEFGAYELEVSKKLIGKYLKANLLNISPAGVAFVKDSVRPGIMPRMLREILDTRLMVKKSMKKHKGNKTLQKVLHSRQLGLKLIANVTYGYTAANFSGRMPACELADSVVSKGRETLQRAIKLVEQNTTWGARVVYGDTDSMFVLCAGKSREDAFKIGEEIAEAVTNANPSPVRLKLEKVYQPCILQTKKRYVGYMYESKEQKVPEFEAKGIETVRRDGCPASSKMLEKCLKLLFDNRDVSEVRNYVLKQFNKILTGRVSIQDLTFAKEYRGREGYRPGACVPALELTRKWMSSDKRKEPRSGERVPYVIINGPPGLPLIKLVKSPYDLLEDSSLRPNALYYITKAIIPPINRCFKLIGADLFNWFNEMPRKQVQYLHVGSPSKGPKSTISQYFATAACASCGVQTKDGLCPKCLNNPQSTIVALHKKILLWERNYFTCRKICESCCGRSTDLYCNSLDCPVLYRTKQTSHDMQQTDVVRSLLEYFPMDIDN